MKRDVYTNNRTQHQKYQLYLKSKIGRGYFIIISFFLFLLLLIVICVPCVLMCRRHLLRRVYKFTIVLNHHILPVRGTPNADYGNGRCRMAYRFL